MIAHYFHFNNIYKSYLKCRSNKRNSRSALQFEWDCERKLVNLQERLIRGEFHPSSSACFIVKKPKLREIFASSFEDRIVHHIIVGYLEKLWEPRFIYDAYSCRKGKGTHKAVQKLQKFIRKISSNGLKRCYFMHLDIKDFFMSIDKQILFNLIKKRVKDKIMLDLVEKNIFNDPTENYCFIGKDKIEISKVPPHKSLFGKNNRRGLPIGNLTSQFYANVYLDPLDQYIKHDLKCHFYLRYCDDIIILGEKEEVLFNWKEDISQYILKVLKLKLNEKMTKVNPINNGIDFLGFVIRRNYILVRNRTVNNLKEKLKAYRYALMKKIPEGILFSFDSDMYEKLLCSLNSYLGHFKHANCFRLINKIFIKYSFLEKYFELIGNKVVRKEPKKIRFKSLKDQYKWYIKNFPDKIIFFQVGCFIEFFDEQAIFMVKNFNLRPLKPRKRFKIRCGFPIRSLEKHKIFCFQKGIPFIIVKQTGIEKNRLMERKVALEFIPKLKKF